MGRIEDNDAERIERLRQEAEKANKKADTARGDKQRQFGAYVTKSQDTKGQQQQQDQNRSEQHNSAKQLLMARRGIASNDLSGQRIDERAMGNDAKRAQGKSRDMESAQGRAGLQRKAEGRTSTSDQMAVSGRGGHGGSDGRSQSKDERKEAASKQTANTQNNFAAVGQAVAAMDGVGAKASSGTAGAPSQLSVKEVIDELVARVHQGLDARAGRHDIATIRIELKDNILAGAVLTFHHEVGSNELTIHVETGDEEVEHMLLGNRTKIDEALQKSNSKLKLKLEGGLTVNGQDAPPRSRGHIPEV